MAGIIDTIVALVLPKKRQKPGGASNTSTFQPGQTAQNLPIPQYRDHLSDIFASRQSNDSRALLKLLFKHDPDVSAAVNAYLTIANTKPQFFVYNAKGELDSKGQQLLRGVENAITKQFDYSLGFTYKPSLSTISENMRYMLLLRGGIGSELVFDKSLIPVEIRQVDLATVEWKEQKPGEYKPVQVVNNDEIDLNIPTFFAAFYHRDPTEIYTYSSFVSSINTIAARQQVINDLYRIMQITGYPRLDVKILEEVLVKNAPANIKQDRNELKKWIADRITEVQTVVTNLRADQAFVHTDAVETEIMNEKNPGASLNIESIIQTLNAQNQAALKTMATIIGRGESGVNTASVESRVFSMNADELNRPVAEILGHIFTLALRLQGFDGWVECKFTPVELRPELELEPHQTMKQARLLELLSHGIIDDNEFHILMMGRPKPEAAPELAGTGFFVSGGGIDVSKTSPNNDPMGRSLAPEGSKSARSKTVKKSS